AGVGERGGDVRGCGGSYGWWWGRGQRKVGPAELSLGPNIWRSASLLDTAASGCCCRGGRKRVPAIRCKYLRQLRAAPLFQSTLQADSADLPIGPRDIAVPLR